MKVQFAWFIVCVVPALAQHTIKGRVLDAGTSAPIAMAKVMLQVYGVEPNRTLAVLTDPSGSFAFGNVPDGNYGLQSMRSGYISGQQSFSGINLTKDSEPEPITLKLSAGAIVKGTVADEKDQPLADANVMVLQRQILDGAARWNPFAFAQTNESGEFRAFGIPSGSYAVCVNAPPSRSLTRQRMTYPGICLGGGSDPGTSDHLSLSGGEEREVQLKVKPVRAFRVEGTVAGCGGQGFGLMFQPVENDLTGPGGNQLQDGVSDARAEATVQVTDSDIRDLQLQVTPDPILVMRVRSQVSSEKPAVQLALDRANEPSIDADGTYKCKIAQSGDYKIMAMPNPPWYIQRIEQGGREIEGDQIHLNRDGAIQPVDVFVAEGGGAIEAVVSGVAVRQSPVVLRATSQGYVPAPVTMMTTVQTTTTDLRSQNVAPGDYLVLLLDPEAPVEYRNPEVMRKYESQGVRVTVKDGETSKIKLTLVQVQ